MLGRAHLPQGEVIQRVCGKALKQRQAAELLSLSTRQIKRLCKAYKRKGAGALISKRRGQQSNNRLALRLTTQAVELLHTHYFDFGPTLAREKLREVDGLALGVESVRQLMIREGLWQPRPARQAVIHQMRERRARLGELVQDKSFLLRRLCALCACGGEWSTYFRLNFKLTHYE